MAVKLLIAAGMLLASTSAFAQGGAPTEQTSEDLVCQLSGACVEAGAEESDEVSEETIESPAAPASPGARISATRGFKIANKVSPAKPAKAAPAAARPKAAATTARAKIATAPGKSAKSAAALKSAGSGRADLKVSFVTGSAELTPFGQREALKFAEALRSPVLSGMRFRIEGHTDAVGSRASNLDLSRRRAQSVVDFLAANGAEAARFDVLGYGFDRPLSGTAGTSAANRRVEVVRIK